MSFIKNNKIEATDIWDKIVEAEQERFDKQLYLETNGQTNTQTYHTKIQHIDDYVTFVCNTETLKFPKKHLMYKINLFIGADIIITETVVANTISYNFKNANTEF